MKPIDRDDEFTVQECLDAIREECKTCDFNYGRVWLLADRIEELIAVDKRTSTPDERPVYSATAPYKMGDKILG